MASRLGWSGAALLSSLLVTTAARAEPTAADRETARTLMDQGQVLKDKGNLEEALKRFKAADDIMHVPTTAVPVAKLQAALGLLVEARDTLASSMRRTPGKATDPQPFKDARAEGERLDASLAGRVPGLTITVKGSDDSDKPALAIDGLDVPAGALGLPRAVDPGHHVVVAKTATAEGRQELDVREGEQKAVEITLVAMGAPAIQVPRGTPGTPDSQATSKTSHSPGLVTWIGVGLAGAGIIAGSVTGLMAISKTPGLTSECPNHTCGPTAHSDLDSANTLAMVSNVGFAVAGVGAAVAVISLVVGHEAATEPPAASAPTTHVWIGLGAAGLRGSF